jgi:hypothetical protein
MFKRVVLTALSVSLLFSTSFAGGSKLPTFGSEMGMKQLGPKTIRPPYTDVTTYYGYVEPGKEPDATIDGKKMYFLYVWIPAVVPEIGVRMASPATAFKEIKKGNVIVADDYNKDDEDNYFDTWINFERAQNVINLETMKSQAESTPWLSYGKNDDSGEMPANPGGAKYNSLLRITSEASNPLKALVRGLYRVAFTTYKKGEVKGTFIAQVAAPIKIPGVLVEKDIDTIIKKLEAAE